MSRKRPPHGNPGDYLWIDTREGGFWRKKRGRGGSAPVNDEFQRNNQYIKLANPAAKQLYPYLAGMNPGRITARFGRKLLRALREKGGMDYSHFEGCEVQKAYPLDHLLKTPYRVEHDPKAVRIFIPLDKLAVSRQNKLATHFYFDAVLLLGEPGGLLSTRCVTSVLYDFDTVFEGLCQLPLNLPRKKAPWMLLLKVSCL